MYFQGTVHDCACKPLHCVQTVQGHHIKVLSVHTELNKTLSAYTQLNHAVQSASALYTTYNYNVNPEVFQHQALTASMLQAIHSL